ncbi:MAG: FAD-dependent oxidoreductase [Phycisphaerae bacterium]|nr:FAD-dependent oxidoreductase [Phycisphaerae bacterium]
MKTIIIGNGILGLTIGIKLLIESNGSHEIVIIGPYDRKGSATMAAGAMLNSYSELDYNTFKSKYSKFHFKLSKEATKLWPKFLKSIKSISSSDDNQINSKCDIKYGTYIINNTVSDDLDDLNYEAIRSQLIEDGEDFEDVNPKDIKNYNPSQNSRSARSLFIPKEGWINPKILLNQIEKIFLESNNCQLLNAKLVHIKHKNNKVSGVKLCNGQVMEADNYILATGSKINDILLNSRLDLNIQRVFHGLGISIEINTRNKYDKCIRTPNRGGACGIYSIPYYNYQNNEHNVLIGASNQILNKSTDRARLISINRLLQGAIEEINNDFYESELLNINIGLRPTTQDLYPLLGRTSIHNLIIASGTKRDGFHLSPVISDFIVKLILKKQSDINFSFFKPERELIKDLSRKDAINLYLKNIMSEQYQHGFRPSCLPMEKQVIESYRNKIEKLHDKVGAYDWGIPPLMVGMYDKGYTN